VDRENSRERGSQTGRLYYQGTQPVRRVYIPKVDGNNAHASTCRGDDRSRDLDITDGRRLDSTKSLNFVPYRCVLLIGKLACLEVKMIGKPYVGKLQVRFDEGDRTTDYGRF